LAIIIAALSAPAVFGQAVTLPNPLLPPEDLPVAAQKYWSPLGLPRLRDPIAAGESAKLPVGAYDVDLLEAFTDVSSLLTQKTEKVGALRVLKLKAGTEWSRPLKKSDSGRLFVSILAYASNVTVVSVGNAWVSIVDSPNSDGLQIMVGEGSTAGVKWRASGLDVMPDQFGGATLANLPVLTIRVDTNAGIWDLYAGPRLIADSIPLSKGEAPNLAFKAGKDGAWVCGLIQTTENPLFADANNNGIDDAFEQKKNGALLPASTDLATRSRLIKVWNSEAYLNPQRAWFLEKPLADRFNKAVKN
jgi:hypothetical protein